MVSISFLILILTALFHRSTCWWDAGHMTVGMIAKLTMEPRYVEYIEGILGEWENYYPNFNSIDTAAIWLDHIKCQSQKPDYCKGMEYVEGIFILNEFHYTESPYNPLGFEYTPTTRTASSTSFLQNSIRSLLNNIHRKSPLQNMLLRGLIHILGDIHQPLHGTSIICRWQGAPNQDFGGNEILLSETQTKKGIKNLHALYDAMGDYQESYPFISDHYVIDKAQYLIEKFPVEVFDNVYNYRDVEKWVAESSIYSEFVYHELIGSCGDYRNFERHPYHPSDDYIQQVQSISEHQVALAGYRLGHVLSEIAKRGLQKEYYLIG